MSHQYVDCVDMMICFVVSLTSIHSLHPNAFVISTFYNMQEEIENEIWEVADALAVKLLQRFNYSVSAIKILIFEPDERLLLVCPYIQILSLIVDVLTK